MKKIFTDITDSIKELKIQYKKLDQNELFLAVQIKLNEIMDLDLEDHEISFIVSGGYVSRNFTLTAINIKTPEKVFVVETVGEDRDLEFNPIVNEELQKKIIQLHRNPIMTIRGFKREYEMTDDKNNIFRNIALTAKDTINNSREDYSIKFINNEQGRIELLKAMLLKDWKEFNEIYSLESDNEPNKKPKIK